MTNFFIETMNNCQAFIRGNDKVKAGFENLEGSNCSGFEYTLQDGINVKIRVDKNIRFVIVETYPGIMVRGVHQSMVAEYCQRVTAVPGVGYLALDQHGSIYHHIEISFRDNPITVRVLQKMEDAALKTLNKHVRVLERLAYGRLPDWNAFVPPADDAEALIDTAWERNLLDANIEQIRTHLMDNGHNVVAENLNPASSEHYFLETLTHDSRFRDYIHILQNGWLIRTVRLDMKCGEAYRTQIAQFCNSSSDEKKIGFLKVADDGYPYCTVATYLLGGENLISRKTLDEMGGIAVTFLKTNEEKLSYIGHGVLPCDGADGIMDGLAKGFMEHMKERAKEDAERPSLLDLLATMSENDTDEGEAFEGVGSLQELFEALQGEDEMTE